MNNKPKILFIDIENIAELGWVWGMFETNVIEIERPGHLLTVAWKWQNEKTQVIGQNDFKGYKPKSTDDKELCKFVWKLMDEADIIIGHNARSFDIKKLNYRFIVNGLPPPSPSKVIDTLVSIKAVAKAPSNKLDSLGKVMKIGQKLEHEGWALWKKCYLGDKDAWNRMKKYNKQDVDLLEKLYLILRPWISNHPNIGIIVGERSICPNCGSKHLQSRGMNYGKRNWFCVDCRSWHYSTLKANSQVR